MSSHPTPHSNTSPWLLLGVGVGASVLGAAAAAATVLYLQPRISAAPPSAAQTPAAEVAKVRTPRRCAVGCWVLTVCSCGPAAPRCASSG